jgi:glycosyltransferase involved in cell wall biosynthesis
MNNNVEISKIGNSDSILGKLNYHESHYILHQYGKKDIPKLKVSVIIPFFNRVDWTIEAVKSVIRQTHKNLEIILVDDGSIEDLKELKKLIRSDKRILYYRNIKNSGVAKSRNLGVQKATGKFIAFLDSDDLFLPEKIKTQLIFMVSNGYVFSHTSYETFDILKERLMVRIDSGKIDLSYPETISDCWISTSTVMINAISFRKMTIKFPEEFSIGEDVCLWILISKQYTLKGLDRFLTKIRIHGFNARNNTNKQIMGFKNVFDFVISNSLDEKSIIELRKRNNQFFRYITKIYHPTNSYINDLTNLIIKYLPMKATFILKRIIRTILP